MTSFLAVKQSRKRSSTTFEKNERWRISKHLSTFWHHSSESRKLKRQNVSVKPLVVSVKTNRASSLPTYLNCLLQLA